MAIERNITDIRNITISDIYNLPPDKYAIQPPHPTINTPDTITEEMENKRYLSVTYTDENYILSPLPPSSALLPGVTNNLLVTGNIKIF